MKNNMKLRIKNRIRNIISDLDTRHPKQIDVAIGKLYDIVKDRDDIIKKLRKDNIYLAERLTKIYNELKEEE